MLCSIGLTFASHIEGKADTVTIQDYGSTTDKAILRINSKIDIFIGDSILIYIDSISLLRSPIRYVQADSTMLTKNLKMYTYTLGIVDVNGGTDSVKFHTVSDDFCIVVFPAYNYEKRYFEQIKIPLRMKTETRTRMFASGFFVNSTVFVTNNHVIRNATGIKLYDNGIEFDANGADILYKSEELDIAILKVCNTKLKHKACSVSSNPKYNLGINVDMFGYPNTASYGKNLKYNRGYISGSSYQNDFHYFQIGGNLNPGNSGGPVTNDGVVIGLVTFSLSYENGGLALKSKYIADLLYELNIKHDNITKNVEDCVVLIEVE